MTPIQVKIAVWLDRRNRVISPLLHGFSLEQLGNIIQGGVWIGKGSGYSKVSGYRTKLINALRNLKPGIIKWPGGPFANTYHWEDGTGPHEKRPKKPNTYWGGKDNNQFGTDEFLRLCEKLEAEPYICLNTESGSVQEAISWLSYCNDNDQSKTASDYYHHTNPLGPKVQFWKIGDNPLDSDNGFNPIQYGKLFKMWGSYLKQRDSSIQLIAPIKNNQKWIAQFFETLKGMENLVDLFSLKTIFPTEPFGGNKPMTPNQYYGLFCYLPLLENRLLEIDQLIKLYNQTDKKIQLVLDSWGIHHPTARIENNLKQVVTLRDSLFAACLLHLFYRFSNYIRIASLNYLVNASHTLFFTKEETIIRTPTYHVFNLLKDHIGSQNIKIRSDSASQKVSNHFGTFSLPLIDAFASWKDETYTLTVSLINLMIENEVEANLSIHGGGSIEGGTATSMTGKSPNDQNNFFAPDRVKSYAIPIQRIDNPMHIKLSPHSITKVQLQIN